MQLVLLLASAALFLYLFEHSDLDRQLAARFFDSERGLFPLRHHWLLEDVLHHGAKQVTYLAVAASMYVCWLGWFRRLDWLPPRNALLAAVGMLLIPIVTTLLKHLTARYCPWDLVEFGGYAPYLGLFERAPEGIKAGQCFPAGHASAGFLWVVWGGALRPGGRRAAWAGIFVGVLAGSMLGGARMIQGAHFLSHTLATLWIAWTLSLVLAVLLGADLRLGSRDVAGTDLRRGGATRSVLSPPPAT